MSLLLAVLCIWLWAAVGHRLYLIYFASRYSLVFDVHPRGLCLAIGRFDKPPSAGRPGPGFQSDAFAVDRNAAFVSEHGAKWGFATNTWDDGWYGATRSVQIPLWALATAAWLLVLWQFCRGARAIPPGCCKVCGYDLRATPLRCPECGTAAAEPTVQAPPTA